MVIARGVLLSSCLVALAASAAFTLPPGWSKAGAKPVYSRSLGPPMGSMDTISVPYMPKSPMFPKFVDPKMMISKKTDMLANLFGGLGPAAYNPGADEPAQYGAGSYPPFLTSILEENKASGKVPETKSAGGKIGDESELYKRGIFGPFSGPKFGGMGPKFGGMPQYPAPDMMSGYGMSDYSRKRRSIAAGPALDLQAILAANKADTKNMGPPPPYPTLSPIAEEPEAEGIGMLKMGSAVPKESMPGMFGPFAPVVNPSMFISKKYAFLDTLFKNIATSTPAPVPTPAEPVPKSTIVPPSFWFPTSMISTPAMYNDKVTEFLDKLFESLQLNKTAPTEEAAFSPKSEFVRSVEAETDETQGRVARSIEDFSSIVSAKDAIVNNILSELGAIKGDMVTTINDLITLEKSMAMSKIPKKGMKPFGPGMWPKGATPDISLPFQQKIMVLSQVFDMLTELQKNITTAVQQTIDTKIAASEESTTMNVNVPEVTADAFFGTPNYPLNFTLLDAIKKRLSSIGMGAPSYGPGPIQMGPKFARMTPKEPTSFWVSYPAASGATAKREINEDFSAPAEEEERNDNNQKHTRGVKMQMHQGYQSLPAGSIETVQAGGGSTPEQQGGGIKLLGANANGNDDTWFDWMQYLRNEHQGHRHNHNHH